MTGTITWRAVAELVGIAAIIAGLVFVGLELRQSRQIAIADIYQQRSAMVIEIHAARLSSEPLAAALNKLSAGDDVTPWEQNLVNTGHYLFLTYWENIHFQHQSGMIADEQWRASQRAMARYLNNTPGAVEFWNATKPVMRDSFAETVDQALAETR